MGVISTPLSEPLYGARANFAPIQGKMAESESKGQENKPHDTMEALDDAFSTPGRVENFINSIEEDLNEDTSGYRTLVGVFKRILLRGAISLIITGVVSVVGVIFALILGYDEGFVQTVLLAIFVPLWTLFYTSMMTDWLPSRD